MYRAMIAFSLGPLLLACAQPEKRADTPVTTVVAATTDDGVVIRFATIEEGGDVLTKDDLYTAQVQAREAGIRGQDAAITSFDEVRPLYRADVQEWTDEEVAALSGSIVSVLDKVNAIDTLLPEEVLLVKTGSVVEGGLPHTRSNAIIFAGGGIPEGDNLTALFLHELHHVLSRANEDQHDEYFSLVGFVPCSFEEPVGLRSPRLSNPDAPTYAHYSPTDNLDADGVIPFLHASRDYDGSGTLPNYFGFGLIPVSYNNGICEAQIASPDGLLAPPEAPEFLEALGGNTGYIIHPEETLADNFVFWAMENDDIPTPQLPEKVGAFWLAAAQ